MKLINSKEKKYIKEHNNKCLNFHIIYKLFCQGVSEGDYTATVELKKQLKQLYSECIEIRKKIDLTKQDILEQLSDFERIEYLYLGLDEILDKLKDHLESGKGNNKYVNDGISDAREISEEDARKAAEAWGEGYIPLIDFLEECIRQKMPTRGCCAGHGEFEDSYVLFEANNEQVLELFDYFVSNKIGFWIAFVGLPETKLRIGIKMEEREHFYLNALDFLRKKRENNQENKQDFKITMLRKIVKIINENNEYNLEDIQIFYEIEREIYRINYKEEYAIVKEDKIEQALFQFFSKITEKNEGLLGKLKKMFERTVLGYDRIKEEGVKLYRMEPDNLSNENKDNSMGGL